MVFGFWKKKVDPDPGARSRDDFWAKEQARAPFKWNLWKNLARKDCDFLFFCEEFVLRKCDYPNSVKTGDFLFGCGSCEKRAQERCFF